MRLLSLCFHLAGRKGSVSSTPYLRRLSGFTGVLTQPGEKYYVTSLPSDVVTFVTPRMRAGGVQQPFHSTCTEGSTGVQVYRRVKLTGAPGARSSLTGAPGARDGVLWGE